MSLGSVLDLAHRPDSSLQSGRLGRAWPGFSIEQVQLTGLDAYDYRFRGDRHYLALHDLVLTDAEQRIDGLPPRQDLDIRDAITFVPSGCGVEGWGKPARERNSFLAVYYDPAVLRSDLGVKYDLHDPAPFVHRRDASLRSTLLKLQRLVEQDDADDLHAESLCLLSAVEVFGVLADPGGRLSDRQLSLVRDFVEANLRKAISLADMADLAGLSRFHFSRSFKHTTGENPTEFVRNRRVERARALLAKSELPIEAIAAAVGFNGAAQFRRAFREACGVSPHQFRSRLR